MTNIAEKNLKYKNSLVNYLESISWTYFFTGTTGYELSLKSARRLANRFFEGFKSEGSLLFWTGERFECRDGYHIHGLIKTPNPYGSLDPENKILFQALIDTWQSAVGNKAVSNHDGKISWQSWSRVDLQAYDPKRGASGYCAKYILKKNADYDILC